MIGLPFDHTIPYTHPKHGVQGVDHGMHPSSNLGIAEFARLYTINELTLGQAVHGLRSYLHNIANYAIPDCNITRALSFLGHRFTEQDEIAIEVGFEGNVESWIKAGNQPQGWYSLFRDNYPSYCREMKRTHDKQGNEGSNSGDDVPDGSVAG